MQSQQGHQVLQAQEAGERECMEVATMLSEVDRRIAETKKDMYEFKRDVIGELTLQTLLKLCEPISDRTSRLTSAKHVKGLLAPTLHCANRSGG